MRYILYQAEDCHLCELAEQVLATVGISASCVDVSQSLALKKMYGIRIPVLRDEITQAELDWPFDVISVQHFQAATKA